MICAPLQCRTIQINVCIPHSHIWCAGRVTLHLATRSVRCSHHASYFSLHTWMWLSATQCDVVTTVTFRVIPWLWHGSHHVLSVTSNRSQSRLWCRIFTPHSSYVPLLLRFHKVTVFMLSIDCMTVSRLRTSHCSNAGLVSRHLTAHYNMHVSRNHVPYLNDFVWAFCQLSRSHLRA